MKRIDVSCGIILKSGTILACMRGVESDHPFEWEFPGGKVEENETAEDCIIRELKEELLIDVNVLKALTPVDFDYSRKKICLIPFLCEIIEGTPTPVEHAKLCWLPIVDFSSLNWSTADEELFHQNLKFLE